ncbi:hypothetical protein [Variovorax ginsengisoli]|uniref:HepT-like domain-containing protein n=1 Tax=Variovorax ginsengisoli TaxID=363844 RepID=A0ABT8SBP5_9BURK|nr:hypothetical protein [Variovorax ginsengisoli]MDN8617169.1 hypothetical protein [Variovorax ginsengisoli]MDO1536339.1 hypothetical protein [Variovorax ginsengisoli]
MGDHVFQLLLLSKANDLELALGHMLDAEERQQQLKIQFPAAYDANFHAAGIATHIQGIYTQIESLLKQAIEATDGRLPKSETWHQDLIRVAGMAIPGERGALLDADGVKSMKAVLGFRHKVRSNYAGELDPERVFEHIPNTVSAVQAAAGGIRELFEPPETPPPERDV